MTNLIKVIKEIQRQIDTTRVPLFPDEMEELVDEASNVLGQYSNDTSSTARMAIESAISKLRSAIWELITENSEFAKDPGYPDSELFQAIYRSWVTMIEISNN